LGPPKGLLVLIAGEDSFAVPVVVDGLHGAEEENPKVDGIATLIGGVMPAVADVVFDGVDLEGVEGGVGVEEPNTRGLPKVRGSVDVGVDDDLGAVAGDGGKTKVDGEQPNGFDEGVVGVGVVGGAPPSADLARGLDVPILIPPNIGTKELIVDEVETGVVATAGVLLLEEEAEEFLDEEDEEEQACRLAEDEDVEAEAEAKKSGLFVFSPLGCLESSAASLSSLSAPAMMSR